MTRFDADDLRRLAAGSAAVLGTVARESADRLAERRRRRGRAPFRFKRRWVVVPVVVVLVVVVLVIVGLILLAGNVVGWY
jgi:hypothetical protein